MKLIQEGVCQYNEAYIGRSVSVIMQLDLHYGDVDDLHGGDGGGD